MSRYFVISPNVDGSGGKVEDFLKTMFEEHVTLMGWDSDNSKGQMFRNMDVGDYVICAQGANRNKRVFFAGKVSSKTYGDWPFQRRLSGFVDLRNNEVLFDESNSYGAASQIPAIYELKKNVPSDKKICNTIKNIVDMAEKNESIEKLAHLVANNKNLILTGAPGTGKTYLAKTVAKMLGVDDDRIGFVQFHPSYDYTDFIEGLRPIHKEGSTEIGFERKDGVFLEFCRKALASPKENFVFIIDEINRGEISKIFGELFFSIDPGYRGEEGKVFTQYSNLWKEEDYYDTKQEGDERKKFYVPKNVYIIGTMNDIDRSVESMDFAFRRRFAFKEIKASENTGMLDELGNEDLKKIALSRMELLNNEISQCPGLNSSYHIGASYFLKLNNYTEESSDEQFVQLWDNHLETLLKEYLRGLPDADTLLEKMRMAYFGTNPKADDNEAAN